MTPIAFTLTGHVPTKKNSMEIRRRKRTTRASVLAGVGPGTTFIAQSKKYDTWEKATVWELLAQRQKISAVRFPLSGKVNVGCVFYVNTMRRCDLLNLMAGVLDALVKAGVLADDDWTHVGGHDGSRVVLAESEAVRITISDLEMAR